MDVAEAGDIEGAQLPMSKWFVNKRRLAVIVLAAGVIGALTATAVAQSQRFPDVAPDHYAFEAVEWAAQVGVTTGYTDGTFKPQRPLSKRHAVVFMERYYDEILGADESADFTRGDMMVLLKAINDGTLRGADTTDDPAPDANGAAQSQRFPDVAADHYAFEAVGWAAEVGVTTGYTDGTFKPQRPLSKRHAVVFMERYYDEILGADESADFTRGDMMVLLKAINDGTLRNTEPEPSDQTEAQPEFITEENDLSRWIKHDLVDEYGDKWPWLKEVWDYTNRADFEYIAGNVNSLGLRILRTEVTGDIFIQNESFAIEIHETGIGIFYQLVNPVHELAHVYTYAHGAAANPVPVAIGWLYFEAISQDCPGDELYAQTAEYTDDFQTGFAHYWRKCLHLPKTPTAEAITVVSQAFSGQTPDWFYETFQKADGQIDYVKLWTAVKDSNYRSLKIVVLGMRDAFGGYCSEQAIWDDMFAGEYYLHPPQIVQPWRDGGCGLRASVVDPPDGTFEAVTAGDTHACALRTDGAIACWGGNDYGQSDAPDGTYEAVAAGGDHTCALRTDGTMACWGGNDSGQSYAPSGTYEAVTASSGYSCALRSGGRIACWGPSGLIEAPGGTYETVTAGRGNNCALSSDDAIVCWGRSAYDGPDGSYEDISTGRDDSCALRIDAAVVCWGRRRGADGRRTYPPAGTYEAVSVGWDHTCALRRDSTVVCWGRNGFGQSDVPAGAYEAVAAGLFYTCALRTDSTVACWGGDPGRTHPPDP